MIPQIKWTNADRRITYPCASIKSAVSMMEMIPQIKWTDTDRHLTYPCASITTRATNMKKAGICNIPAYQQYRLAKSTSQ